MSCGNSNEEREFNLNRNYEKTSLQVSNMGVVNNLATADFDNAGRVFLIKNDGTDTVELEVNLASMAQGQYVTTKFEVGWNPELVRSIKQNASASSYDLKWGY